MKTLINFNEGSQWRRFWPVLVLTSKFVYFSIWIAGKYRYFYKEFKR